MSIYKNGKLIAGGRQCMPLLSFMWADHVLNDASWLRADTYSWQSGAVYQAAYAHLEDDIIGAVSNITVLNTGTALYETYYRYTDGDITGYYAWELNGVIIYTESQIPSAGDVAYVSISPIKTFEIVEIAGIQSETIGGITIQFYLADDGHKICPASEESNVASIYAATGVAWYYIIDTVNTRFKLPRTKFAFTGIRNGVGGYVEAGLPNITGSFSTASDKNLGTGAFSWTNDRYSTNGGGKGGQWGINFSAQNSNSVYGNSDTVQPKATEMYLYFYVGNFTQTALENTAGITTEEMNNKADKDDAVGYCSFNTDTRIQITTTNQTAAKNGWLIGCISFSGSNKSVTFYVNSIIVGRSGWATGSQWFSASICLPIKAGQTYRFACDGTVENNQMYFYPND